ncbi:Hypothetical predicted protein, partial [Podarcis lilfordi]
VKSHKKQCGNWTGRNISATLVHKEVSTGKDINRAHLILSPRSKKQLARKCGDKTKRVDIRPAPNKVCTEKNLGLDLKNSNCQSEQHKLTVRFVAPSSQTVPNAFLTTKSLQAQWKNQYGNPK